MNRRSVTSLAGLLSILVVGALAACGDAQAPVPADLAARLERDTGTRWIVDNRGRYGTPDLIVPATDPPAILHPGDDAAEVALRFLTTYQSAFGTSNLRSQLRHVETDTDRKGMVHVRFQQVQSGVLVVGAGLSVHFKKNGAVAFVNGDFVPKLPASTSPTLDENAARVAAQQALDGGQKTTSAALVLEPYFGTTPVLAWQVAVEGRLGARRVAATVTVDATSGAIRLVDSAIYESVGSGVGIRGYAPVNDANDRKYFEITEEADGSFSMVRPVADGESVVSVSTFGGGLITSKDRNDWDPIAAAADGKGSAVDTFNNVNLADQFYRGNFGWKSYDNQGSKISIVVHDNSLGVTNAFWDGSVKELHFGDGNLSTGGDSLSRGVLDTTGHELTHAVTAATSKLVYSGESGALNESFSDVFGCLMEHQNQPDDALNMIYGEKGSKSGTPRRSMLHPGGAGVESVQPDHVSKQLNQGETPSRTNDHGGVHGNSGISNNAFALMVVGGKNDTSGIKVEGGGWEVAQQVWWYAQRYSDSSATDFNAHARWMVASTVKMGFDPKPVACAWVATGVLTEEYVRSSWQITCSCPAPDGGSADAGACCAKGQTDTTCCTVCAPDGGADANAPDTCAGKRDGFYCSEVALYSGYTCEGGAIAYGQQCTEKQRCAGSNGKGNIICK